MTPGTTNTILKDTMGMGISTSNITDISSLPPTMSMKNVINGTHYNVSIASNATATMDTLPTLKERERGIPVKQISMISEISNDTSGDSPNDNNEDDQDDEESIVNEADHDQNVLATPSSDITKHSSDSPISLRHTQEMMMYSMNKKTIRENKTRLHKISITAPSATEMGFAALNINPFLNGGNITNTATTNSVNTSFKRNKNIMIPNPIRTRSATLNTTNTPSQGQSQLTQNGNGGPFQLEKDGSYSEHSSASNIMNILSDGEDGGFGFVTSPSGIQTDGVNGGRYNHGRNQNHNGLALPLQKTRSDNFVNTTTTTPNNSKTDIYAHSQRINKFPHIKNGNYNNEQAQNNKAKRFSPYQNMHSQPNHRNYKFDIKKGIFKGDNNDNPAFGKEYGLSAQSYRDREKSPGITPLSLAMPKSCGHTPQSSVNAATLWQNMDKLKKSEDLTIDTMATTPNGDSARCDCDTKYDGDDDEEEDTTSHRTCMIHGNTPIRSQNDDALNMSVNMHINDPEYEKNEQHENHVNMNENDVGHIYESLSSHDNEASPTFNLISKITSPMEMNPRSKPQTPSRKRKALELLGISSNESSTPSNFNHSFSYNATFSRRNNLRNYSSYSSKSKSKSSRFLNSKRDKDGSKKSRGISLRNKLSKSKSTKSTLPKSSKSRPITAKSNDTVSKSKSKGNQNHHHLHQNIMNHHIIPDENPQFGGPKQPILTHSTSQHSSRHSSRPTSQYSSRPNTARSIQSITRSNRSNNKLIQQKTNIQHHKSSNVISSKSPQQTPQKAAFRLHGARSNGHTPQSINDKSPNGTNHVSRGWFFDYKNNNKSMISNPSPHSMNRYYGSPIANTLGSPNANGHNKSVIINNLSNISTKHEYYRSQGVNGLTRGYSGNTPKSFSKTLTQSELRDIVYEENDVILMEAIKNSKLTPNSDRGNSPNSHHLHLGTHSGNMMDILSLKHTNSNSGSAHQHNNTIFVSNSYHRDNVLSANNNPAALNKRIFELLALNNTTCGTLESSFNDEEEHTPLDMVTNSNQLQTASVPPKMDEHAYGTSDEPPPFDTNALDLRKAFSLPNDQHTNTNDQQIQYTKPKLKGKNNTVTGTVSTNAAIDIHYACNEIDQSDDQKSNDDEHTVSRLKLIGIPSQVDDIVVDIGKIQDMNRAHHKKNRSTSTKSKFSRTGAGNTSITTDNGNISLQDLDYETEDDQTLNTEMLILGRASPSPNPRIERFEPRHVRNGTNATITFVPHDSNINKSNPKSSQEEVTTDFEDMEEEKQLHTDECDEDLDIKEQEDFFPAPKDYNKDKKRRHQSSRSLLDELGRFAGIFHQSSKLSMSFSSKSNKSIKPRRLTNESVNKRRSRSMPSIDGIEELNGDSIDSVFDHDEQQTMNDEDEEEEKGDIVSLLSVLVKHGFYTKTNLNSVQQLTTYAKQ